MMTQTERKYQSCDKFCNQYRRQTVSFLEFQFISNEVNFWNCMIKQLHLNKLTLFYFAVCISA